MLEGLLDLKDLLGLPVLRGLPVRKELPVHKELPVPKAPLALKVPRAQVVPILEEHLSPSSSTPPVVRLAPIAMSKTIAETTMVARCSSELGVCLIISLR